MSDHEGTREVVAAMLGAMGLAIIVGAVVLLVVGVEVPERMAHVLLLVVGAMFLTAGVGLYKVKGEDP